MQSTHANLAQVAQVTPSKGLQRQNFPVRALPDFRLRDAGRREGTNNGLRLDHLPL